VTNAVLDEVKACHKLENLIMGLVLILAKSQTLGR
jgi:hypothetical protein